LLLFCFIVMLGNAQTEEKVVYVSENNDYRLLIDKTTKVQKQKLADSHLETFIFTQNNQFKFSLTISQGKAKNLTNDSLFHPKYEQAYLNNCGCEILSSKPMQFNHIKSLQFKIKRVEKGRTLIGYTESFVVNKTLFNIIFITFESNFPSYKNEYDAIMNTFIINE
jgi:hypothetical protein